MPLPAFLTGGSLLAKLLKGLIDDIEEQFVKDVARARGISIDELSKIADGRIFSARRAKELGLIDRLGNFHDAVDLAKELTHIKGEVKLVYPRKGKLELLDLLMQSAAKAFVRTFRDRPEMVEYMWEGIR